ncbi:MAG: hypothetical protein KatS3mg105_2546 [Gemmatales bacterium]|nr:MAG: hypothetical protein KatS3mg105_2546 [Gemmatales bacterium]
MPSPRCRAKRQLLHDRCPLRVQDHRVLNSATTMVTVVPVTGFFPVPPAILTLKARPTSRPFFPPQSVNLLTSVNPADPLCIFHSPDIGTSPSVHYNQYVPLFDDAR